MQEGPEFLCLLLVSVNKTANKISGKTGVAAGLRGVHKILTEISSAWTCLGYKEGGNDTTLGCCSRLTISDRTCIQNCPLLRLIL